MPRKLLLYNRGTAVEHRSMKTLGWSSCVIVAALACLDEADLCFMAEAAEVVGGMHQPHRLARKLPVLHVREDLKAEVVQA